MATRYSTLHTLSQRIGATRPGTWLFSRLLPRADPVVLRLTRGRKTLSSLLAGFPEVLVTTRGAKSGQPRSTLLLCIRDQADPNVFALVASSFGQLHNPAWYYNLKACPRATCSFPGQVPRDYAAHEATGGEYEKFWRLAADTYVGFPLYKQRAAGRHIPIMVMVPA